MKTGYKEARLLLQGYCCHITTLPQYYHMNTHKQLVDVYINGSFLSNTPALYTAQNLVYNNN